MKQKDKKVWTPYVMVFPAFAVMMLVVVLPIINTILDVYKRQVFICAKESDLQRREMERHMTI